MTNILDSIEMNKEIARCTKQWNDWVSSLPSDVAKELEEAIEKSDPYFGVRSDRDFADSVEQLGDLIGYKKQEG